MTGTFLYKKNVSLPKSMNKVDDIKMILKSVDRPLYYRNARKYNASSKSLSRTNFFAHHFRASRLISRAK